MKKKIDPFYLVLIVAVLALLWYNHSNQTPDISNQAAPPIAGTSLSGNQISLEDLKGHYVLVDFWASWCSPCRRANPKVVRLYAKYKDKGLEIFSVGLESNPNAWKAAIEKDHLNWPNHIMEDRRGNMPISNAYGVQSIPTKFLIDPEGVIIATNPSFGKIDRILSKKLDSK